MTGTDAVRIACLFLIKILWSKYLSNSYKIFMASYLFISFEEHKDISISEKGVSNPVS